MRHFLLATLVLISTMALSAEKSPIAVVVSEQSPIKEMNKSDIAAIFMGQLASLQAAHSLIPLDSEESELRDMFYQMLLGRSNNQMRAYWSRMVFVGQGKPPTKATRDNLQNKIPGPPPAISYVPANEVGAGLKVIYVLH
jgi:hypothetical protein